MATDDTPQHRVLEGVLLRLARSPSAEQFVLRGGVLMRHWFRPVPRPADDIDLIVNFPFDIADATARFLAVLADTSVPDGVVFDSEAARGEGIWLGGGNPGVRVFATGTIDGTDVDFHTDMTFGPFPRPVPTLQDLPTGFGEPARVWACRPEAIVGHKMQAMWHRGLLGWRPKDLDDLRLLFARVPMNADDLREAVVAYLADVGGTPAKTRDFFTPDSWWHTKMAAARWGDYLKTARGAHAPRNLESAVAPVAAVLAPILEAWS